MRLHARFPLAFPLALLLALLLAFPGAAPLHAAPRTTDLPSAFGGTVRVWHDAPANPWASVILFAGGDGVLGLGADSAIRSLGGNFLIRTRQAWLAQGLAVLIPDAPASVSGLRDERARPEHAADIAAMVRLARQLHPAAPVWLVGTSNGTVSAANGAAASSTRGQLAGLVLTSTVTRRGRQGPQSATVFSLPLAAITVPTLVVAHQRDECVLTPPDEAARIRAALTAAPRTELLLMDGGLPATSGPCEARSAHGYLGIENDVIARITTWMRR